MMYRLTTGWPQRTEDLVFVNPESEEYLSWIAEGNTPLPPLPTPIPNVVTMRQARLALLAAGYLPSVDAAITAMPSPQKEQAQIEWDYSNTVDRNMPLVGALAAALGLDEAGLDQLFITASSL